MKQGTLMKIWNRLSKDLCLYGWYDHTPTPPKRKQTLRKPLFYGCGSGPAQENFQFVLLTVICSSGVGAGKARSE